MFGGFEFFGSAGPPSGWRPAQPQSHEAPWEPQSFFLQPPAPRTAREWLPVPLKDLKIGEGGWVDGQALRTDADGQIWVNPDALAHGAYHETDATIYLQRDEYAWLADLRRLPSRREGGFGKPQPGPIPVWEVPGLHGDRDAFRPSACDRPSGDWCEPVLRVFF
jgi:hypothetical protein